jgi:hypothetical protein
LRVSAPLDHAARNVIVPAESQVNEEQAGIAYVFAMADGRSFRFEVRPDRPSTAQPAGLAEAEWTRLSFHQCPGCPLDVAQHRHCPAALDLQAIASAFRDLISYEETRVEVTTPERTFVKQCDVQTGLRALMGLVMATSGCPVLSKLKGLAHYHLPFATVEETTFRTVSLYLLRQYFVHRDGGVPDLALRGLLEYYDQLQDLDQAFQNRLRVASTRDANLNAINSLFSLAAAVALSLEDQLEALRAELLPRGNQL